MALRSLLAPTATSASGSIPGSSDHISTRETTGSFVLRVSQYASRMWSTEQDDTLQELQKRVVTSRAAIRTSFATMHSELAQLETKNLVSTHPPDHSLENYPLLSASPVVVAGSTNVSILQQFNYQATTHAEAKMLHGSNNDHSMKFNGDPVDALHFSSPSTPPSPLKPGHPSRLIIIARAGTLRETLTMQELVHSINTRLESHEASRHLHVVSAKLSCLKHLLLTTRLDQTGAELKLHADKFLDILLLPDSLGDAVELMVDDLRYRIVVKGIPTKNEKEEIHTTSEITEQLLRDNPVFSTVKMIGAPQWIKAEADLLKKGQSSIVLDLATAADAITLVERGHLALFADYRKVVKYTGQSSSQCKDCAALGHYAGCSRSKAIRQKQAKADLKAEEDKAVARTNKKNRGSRPRHQK